MSDRDTIARSTQTTPGDWRLLSKDIPGDGSPLGLEDTYSGSEVRGGTVFSVYEHRKMGMTAFLDKKSDGAQHLLVIEDRTFSIVTNEEVSEGH